MATQIEQITDYTWISDYELIKPNIRKALDDYGKHHYPVGDFLRALLSNNLKDACGRADMENIRVIPLLVSYVYNELPSNCWGSPTHVALWLGEISEQDAHEHNINAAVELIAKDEKCEASHVRVLLSEL